MCHLLLGHFNHYSKCGVLDLVVLPAQRTNYRTPIPIRRICESAKNSINQSHSSAETEPAVNYDNSQLFPAPTPRVFLYCNVQPIAGETFCLFTYDPNTHTPRARTRWTYRALAGGQNNQRQYLHTAACLGCERRPTRRTPHVQTLPCFVRHIIRIP